LSFKIETGVTTGPSFGFDREAVMTAALDSLPPDAPQQDIDRKLYYIIRQMLHKPRKAETVRRAFLANLHIIVPLAERDPPIFDQIIEELYSALLDRT
jgi:hypothetical protein